MQSPSRPSDAASGVPEAIACMIVNISSPRIVMSDLPPRRRRPVPKSKQAGAPLWLMGLLIAGLIGVMVWVTDRMVEYNKLQQCVTAGRRDCGQPIDVNK